LPLNFTSYRASSARRIRVSGVEAVEERAAPMETPTVQTSTGPSSTGTGQGDEQPCGEGGGRIRVARVLDDDGELVAAEPGRGVARADLGAQPVGELDEHGVAGLVAVGVVDRLEVVEVDQQQRDGFTGPRERSRAWWSRSPNSDRFASP
jgi:hypothetical protein